MPGLRPTMTETAGNTNKGLHLNDMARIKLTEGQLKKIIKEAVMESLHSLEHGGKYFSKSLYDSDDNRVKLSGYFMNDNDEAVGTVYARDVEIDGDGENYSFEKAKIRFSDSVVDVKEITDDDNSWEPVRLYREPHGQNMGINY